MAESTPTAANTRPDADILEEIESRVVHAYPPLAKNRHRLHIHVQDGVVTLEGHLNTPQTRDYLLSRIVRVPGVRAISADALYDDEALRLALGAVLPYGVSVMVQYGGVLLFGVQPQERDQASIEAAVYGVPGVRSVVSNLRPHRPNLP